MPSLQSLESLIQLAEDKPLPFALGAVVFVIILGVYWKSLEVEGLAWLEKLSRLRSSGGADGTHESSPRSEDVSEIITETAHAQEPLILIVQQLLQSQKESGERQLAAQEKAANATMAIAQQLGNIATVATESINMIRSEVIHDGTITRKYLDDRLTPIEKILERVAHALEAIAPPPPPPAKVTKPRAAKPKEEELPKKGRARKKIVELEEERKAS